METLQRHRDRTLHKGSTRSSICLPGQSWCRSSWSTCAWSGSAASTCPERAPAAGLQPPQLPRPVRDRHAGPPSRLLHGQARAVRKALAGLGARTRSAPFPSTAAPATATRWRPPARSSSGATAWSSSPRAPGCATVRSAPPRRGIGRLALETGAPVAPVAVIGTEEVRRGWRIRPRKVRLRVRAADAPSRPPSDCSPALAAAVTERMWACVQLQWEWLGGDAQARPSARRP